MARAAPTATFTPTAARLRLQIGPETPALANMQAIIAEAIRQGIAADLQQSRRSSVASGFCLDPGHDLPPHLQGAFPPLPEQSYHAPSQGSQSPPDPQEEGQRELDLSDDEGLAPDQPAFTGLFQPSLFKPLLFKAKNSAQPGAQTAVTEPEGQPLLRTHYSPSQRWRQKSSLHPSSL